MGARTIEFTDSFEIDILIGWILWGALVVKLIIYYYRTGWNKWHPQPSVRLWTGLGAEISGWRV